MLNESRRSGWLFYSLLVILFLSGCASTPALDYPRTATHALEKPEDTALGHSLAPQLEKHTQQSGFRLLASGTEAYAARIALIDAAEKTLDLQYYIIRADDSTRLLMHHIMLAAQRGVRIRLLVDDIYAVGKELKIAALAEHPNIEVRVFNPFTVRSSSIGRFLEFIGRGEQLNKRMHNKLLIADNMAVVLGGRNLGNEYFQADNELSFFDLDILAAGPVVRRTSNSFDEYWNSEWSIPIEAYVDSPPSKEDYEAWLAPSAAALKRYEASPYAKRLADTPLAQQIAKRQVELIWAKATALWDKPEKLDEDVPQRKTHLVNQLNPLLDKTQHDLLLISPYFIPGKKGMERLSEFREQDIHIRILTNSLASTDVSIVHQAYANYRKPLLEKGIQLYEFKPQPTHTQSWGSGPSLGSSRASLHAKAVVIDHRVVLIGSFNIDPRSFNLNTEISLVIDSPELAVQVEKLADNTMSLANSFQVELADGKVQWRTQEKGEILLYDHEPQTSFWKRFSLQILSIFAPEELL